MILSKVLAESTRQAWQQLTGNKLRTFLSLLGISIGIFCIIGVLSAVASLKQDVETSLAELGEDVVWIQKWPWKDNSNDWWNLWQRPNPDYDDYEILRDRLASSSALAYFTYVGSRPLKFGSATVEGSNQIGVTYDFQRIFNLKFARGRYFSTYEYESGADRAVLGADVARDLFGPIDPVGRTMKIGGRKYEVVGVLEKDPESVVTVISFDDEVILGFNNAARFTNMNNRSRFDGTIIAKTAPGVAVPQLMDDVRGIMRAARRLRPREDDNFALNELSMTADATASFFGVLNTIGIIIGGFSILVGGISVANIMFVSVKERTSLIGVKKALGARQYIILIEFLTESIILCIIGGLMGLALVVGITRALSAALDFDIVLTVPYAITGVLLSALIGVVAGAIPAALAARMDPVEAIRS